MVVAAAAIVLVRSGLGRVLDHSALAVDLVLVQARSKVRDLPASKATAATQFARAARAAELTTEHPPAAVARAPADRALPQRIKAAQPSESESDRPHGG